MARKLDEQEPLLTAVARKLGEAAGTLANMLSAEQATTETNQQENQDSTDKKTASPTGRNRSAKQSRSRAKKSNSRPQKASSSAQKAAGANRASLTRGTPKQPSLKRQASKRQASKRRSGRNSSGRA